MKLELPAPMRRALDLAASAARAGEVPVAAVITKGGKIVAEGVNAMRAGNDPTAHAEIVAIRAAAAVLHNQRLDECDLWVTLEPCPMCAGAISHARLARLYFATADAKGGAVENGPRLFNQPSCFHRPEVYSGLGANESAEMLRSFFAERR